MKIAVIFGGRSGEHEVSRNSAFTIAQSLCKNYDVISIGISKAGDWYGPVPLNDIKTFRPENYLKNQVTLLPSPQSKGKIYSLPELKLLDEVQVVFPVLHGTFGEDGTIQGFFEMAGVPYVGSNVLGTAVGMDKIIMKKLFAQANLPQVPFLHYLRNEIENNISIVIEEIEKELEYPVFVKPANMGSSVGIAKADNKQKLHEALLDAARFDRKVVVEKGYEVREIEISVLGNDEPKVSLPGEVVPGNDFYDYKAKYVDDNSALYIPARLKEEKIKRIQEIAIEAYKTLDCSGLSRIDFFVRKDNGEILINEINTLPGFTNISMYPKLWEHSGISLDALTDELVQLALERSQDVSRNITSYTD